MPDHRTPPAPAFSVSARVRSIRYALRGIGALIASQHNAWIHVSASTLVVVLAFSLGLFPSDWCWLVMAMVGVWTAEAFNTALEFLCDVASPEFHPLIAKSKDIAAAAVLVSAAGAVCIGLLVFCPRLIACFR
jgi:diacylglycerol kinase (ATP)